ncbi:hypothetical protein [[Pseudomonas] boreopolis]|uniref:hypothetical protein n=1 Tax=Xanthomonas boreopolis TaxID=86183 RepID=UPI003D9FFB77
MIRWPDYAEVRFADYVEEFDPSVERTEMERGVPKQRIVNSEVLQSIQASVQFRSAEAVVSFERWYFEEVGRIGWFTMEHPRTGETITARFRNGSIGQLVPLNTLFRFAKRDLVLEYLR